jgi:hypothetical protein
MDAASSRRSVALVCGTRLGTFSTPAQPHLWVQVWEDSPGKLAYSSGRFEVDTLSDDGRTEEFPVLSNTTVFLCQRGMLHWGKRVIVSGYEAHDITRGITMFGSAVVTDALINRQSSNRWSEFPGAHKLCEKADCKAPILRCARPVMLPCHTC